MGQAIQLVPRGAPLDLERGEQRRGDNRGGDAVLVARNLRVRAEPDGFLVAESQLGGARDPLEARERRVVDQAVRLGDAGDRIFGTK